jgi:hypothetical protein
VSNIHRPISNDPLDQSDSQNSRSLYEKDTSSTLSVSIKEGKYILYQKLHAIQQSSDPNNAAAKQSEQNNNNDNSNPTDPSNHQSSSNDNSSNLPSNTAAVDTPRKPTTILTLPTEIRLMIYGYLFTSLTENTLARTHTYPLPPLLRANAVFRHESLQEWGSHLERVVAQHKEVQLSNERERRDLEMRGRDLAFLRLGNRIKHVAMVEANAGQSIAVFKRLDKLRELQAHQMLAESGAALGAGGSGERWRDGRV